MSCKPVQWKCGYKTKFLLSLRNFELSKVIFFADDYSKIIAHFITSLLKLEVNISRYQDYYWEIKNLVTGYVNCCYHLTKQIYKIDAVILNLEKFDFLNYISQTRKYQNDKHIKFIDLIKFFNLDISEENFESKYKEFMTKLDEIEETSQKFDRIEPYRYYLQEQYNKTLAWLDDLYEFAADHIGFIIYQEKKSVKASLQENHNTHLNNVKKLKEEHSKICDNLRLDIYKKTKILQSLSKSSCSTKPELDEVEKSIEAAKKKIQEINNEKSSELEEVEGRRDYFENSLESFEEICTKIQKIEEICQDISQIKDQTTKLYNKRREQIEQSKTLDDTAKEKELFCLNSTWDKFMDECTYQTNYVGEKLSNTKKSLVTFFCVKGKTRVMCLDHIGRFYLDEYGRKIYNKHFAMKEYRDDGDGNLKQLQQANKFAYDSVGCYVEHAGKITNQLNQLNQMIKVPKEPRETEAKNVHDTNVKATPLIPKGALSRDDVNYLWDVLDPVLSKAMCDVARFQSSNHIFNLAHRVITYTYGSNEVQLKRGEEEAVAYREKMYADRREAKLRSNEKWAALQMKAPPLKDLDDQHIATYFNIRDQCIRAAFKGLD